MAQQVKIITDVSTELLTATQVKSWLKIKTSEDDTLIGNMIKAARIAAEKYCNSIFAEKTLDLWTDEIDTDDYHLELPYPPHKSITGVYRLDQEETETELTLNSGYYKKGLTVFTIIVNKTVATSIIGAFNVNPLRVQYKAGYEASGEAWAVPEDIILAMRRIIANNYEFREDFQEGGIALIPEDAKKLLNPYRYLTI